MSDHNLSRRRVLQALGATGATAAVAGCLGGGDGNGNGNGNETTRDDANELNQDTQEVELADAQGDQNNDPEGWQTQWAADLEVQMLERFDSAGDAAWDMDAHPHVYVTSHGPGYSGQPSNIDNVGVAIIDADTHEVVATRQYDLGFTPFEAHGSAVSPDGQYIYIPTGNTRSQDMQGRLLIIDAETLNLDSVLACQGFPHHIKTFERYDGKPLVLAYTFNWQIDAWGGAGSGHWVMDHENDHEILGGIHGSGEPIQANPYLSFVHPDGRHLYVGCPPGQRDSDITHHIKGIWAVVDMESWQPVDYFAGGYDPIWVDFSADGQYAFLSDGGSDTVTKINCATGEEVDYARSGVHGVYGIRLNETEDKLYSVGKGEASHNMGRSLGLIDPNSMGEVNQWDYGCLRGDHALLNPFSPDELWVSCNANMQDLVWNMETDETKTTVDRDGSSHNGAFVDYSDGGEVVFDQNGWQGSAKEDHRDDLGVDEVVQSHSQFI